MLDSPVPSTLSLTFMSVSEVVRSMFAVLDIGFVPFSVLVFILAGGQAELLQTQLRRADVSLKPLGPGNLHERRCQFADRRWNQGYHSHLAQEILHRERRAEPRRARRCLLYTSD